MTMKMKHSIKSLFLASLACGTALLPVGAQAVSLKESSIISGNTITLGDVFYDLPAHEDKVLGNAPKPGQDMVLNSRTLLRIALAMELDWKPSSAADKVIITRDATTIEESVIEDRLVETLLIEGVSGDFTVNIPEENRKITLPSDQPAEFEISQVSVSDDQKSFKAIISAPSESNPVYKVQVSGKIQPVVSVPVLRDNIQNGRIITANDIEMKKIRDLDFTPDVIADTNKLIGMTARRMIMAGRAIKETDVIAQRMVERGNLVILTLNAGPLSLTTEGKALEHGAKGDVIRVLNTASNQTLQAIVVAENLVQVNN